MTVFDAWHRSRHARTRVIRATAVIAGICLLAEVAMAAGGDPLSSLEDGSMAIIRSAVSSIARVAAAVWVIGSAFLWWQQDALVFPANRTALGDPKTEGWPLFEMKTVTTSDGLSLNFWAHAPFEGRPTVIFFHGNGAKASWSARYLSPLAKQGYGVILSEYRGYGGNQGTPSEKGVTEDGRGYVAWAAQNWGVRHPVLFGESIGTGVAMALATETQAAAVILDAPFTSLADVVAAGPYFWAPTFFLHNRFESLSHVKDYHGPILVIHGLEDPLIPPSHSRAIMAAARCPAGGIFLEGIGHPAFGADHSGRALKAVEDLLESIDSVACLPA